MADVESPYEPRFGESFKAPIFSFGAMVDDHPISAKDQGSNLGRNLYLEYSSDTKLIAGIIWNGDILVADIEELGQFGRVRKSRLNGKRSVQMR